MSHELERIKSNIGELDNRFGAISGKAVAAGTAIGVATTAVIALGTAAFKLGAEFDDAADSILIKSGAMGDALEQLQTDFNEVVKNVPTSFENAATAIGLLHARTGQVGEGLQELSTQILNLSRLTGTDVSENVRQASRFFGDWSVSTEMQSEALDKLFRAAQMSGQSVSQLASQVVQFGAPMRQLGIDMDTAISLFAKWEKEGVNVETVAGTMRQALAKLADAGLDPATTFDRLINTIRDMEDPIEATAFAMEIFGKRGGADMAAAIREGRFAVDDYKQSLQDAGGAITDAARKTDDAKQEMEKAWNELKVAAQPVVQAVFEAMNAAITLAVPLMKDFARELRNIAEAFKAMKEGRVSWQEVAAAAMGIDTRPGTGTRTELPTYAPSPREGFPTLPGSEPANTGDSGVPDAGPGLTPEELAAIRKASEEERALAREIERERKRQQADLERDQKAAAREADRIIKEQQRQAERQAEIEAQRANTLRELGERRANALEAAEEAYNQAWQKALDKEEEQIARAEAQFQREKDLREERERLQNDVTRGAESLRDTQAARGRETSDTRAIEDRDIRRAREEADLLTRRAQQSVQERRAEEQDRQRLNAAIFAGDSRATLAAMLAAEQRKKAVKDTAEAEIAALNLRRQREDEDFERMRSRRAEDLATQKANAAEMAAELARLNDPLIAFANRLAEEKFAEQISAYAKAKEDAVIAAENLLGARQMQAESQFQAGVERAANIGLSQTVILNNYNYGAQGPDTVQDMMGALLEESADKLAAGATQ